MGKTLVTILTKKNGPYVLKDKVPMSVKSITTNSRRESVGYDTKRRIETTDEEICLCRCGKTKDKPFCDGHHEKIEFDSKTTAPHNNITDEAEVIRGATFTLLDNEKYCAFARFCDPLGGVWNLITSGNKEDEIQGVKEALLCPSGRLMIIENETGDMIEHNEQNRIDFLEDTIIGRSGPIALRGNFVVTDEDGLPYEQRHRQTLCRCGRSNNKPFCDGSHAS